MNEKLIMKCIFGSHLYGTSNENSDTDYKGIFFPSKEQIFLGKIPKSITTNTKKGSNEKNSPEDIDTEIYSLHYFIHLACQGETVALDMLHAPDTMILETSDIWKELVEKRELFYTKNLKAFIGYARRQASKYGIKGSRLNDAKKVLDFCKDPELSSTKLKRVWDHLPTGEHIFKLPPDPNGVRLYEVCGRKVGETCSLEYLYDTIEKFHDNYGKRAIKAAKNEGVDWKAVSHALRAAYQTKQILTENTITFPLKEASYLRDVKEGKLHFIKEVSPKLDSLMDEVEELSKQSKLPEKVDRKYWDKFIIDVIDDNLYEKESEKPCPCTHQTPCSYACTCANPVMSAGCSMCNEYSNKKEKETK